MSEDHGNLIKSPKQLILMVFASFFVPLIIILLLMVYADSGSKKSAGNEHSEATTLIKPVANLNFKDASAPKVNKSGEEIYKAVCSSCHATGVAGAPAVGNVAAWTPRISKGYESLLTSALKGKNAMPARGGASPDDISDFEIGRSIVYMANSSGGKLAEPKEPATSQDDTKK